MLARLARQRLPTAVARRSLVSRRFSSGVFDGATTAELSSAATAPAASALRGLLTKTRFKLPVVGNLTISEVFGHSAFALAGTAFLDPDILNLRILSVASGGATLVFTYFHPVGKPLWLPFMWNALFMLINSGHIYRIVSEQLVYLEELLTAGPGRTQAARCTAYMPERAGHHCLDAGKVATDGG